MCWIWRFSPQSPWETLYQRSFCGGSRGCCAWCQCGLGSGLGGGAASHGASGASGAGGAGGAGGGCGGAAADCRFGIEGSRSHEENCSGTGAITKEESGRVAVDRFDETLERCVQGVSGTRAIRGASGWRKKRFTVGSANDLESFLFSSTPSPRFPMIPIQIVIMNPRISWWLKICQTSGTWAKKFFGDVLKLKTGGNDSFLEGDQKETHLRVMIWASPKSKYRSHDPWYVWGWCVSLIVNGFDPDRRSLFCHVSDGIVVGSSQTSY